MTVQNTLASQLKDFQNDFLPKVPQAVVETMSKATADLANSGIVDKSLKVGATAPDFELSDPTGKRVKLSALLVNGPVVLNFYRGEWCPYCNLEIRAFQQLLPEFQQAGAQVVAVSPELPDNSLTMQEKHELSFPVLSDVGNVVARDYGLVFSLDASLRPLYQGFGIDIPAHNGDESYDLPVPATYVVDTSGTVRYAYANADYTLRAEPAEVLAEVQSL
ncbi:AhpC/TSA family protein [filamentous cyanobacterium LEGE 11480]|uniref:thioredoxin-dependent peroxiredoxin n=1 Tax=Romeriopsis navalis LEGE 11480 TaxID=2777977 RepID=A0A928Z2L5_9CYAN|nr:peroxiredoxin-like family protein [Romeriopsis navalis]MBE9030511.1 AhpC/TSA family protein [Romeriopsis navalis LEGE 11480]